VAYIYKITNVKNNKSYVGMTNNPDPYHRWKQHIRTANRVTKNKPHHMDLINEMYKIGTDYFSFDVIEECESWEVNSRESHWITYLNSHVNGYNMVTPGNRVRSGNLMNKHYKYRI
jgi:group I intron endonuclease